MVRAGSLKYGASSPIVKRLLIALSVLVVVVLIYFLATKILLGNDAEGEIKKATSTSVPNEVTNQIDSIGFKVYQPAAVLTFFYRTNVEIVTEARTRSDCKEVLQNYQGSESADVAYIDIYSYSLECPFPKPQKASQITIGSYEGWISRPEGNGDGRLTSVLLEVVVEQSYVRIETDLPFDTLEETIRTFVPYSAVPPEDSLKITIS